MRLSPRRALQPMHRRRVFARGLAGGLTGVLSVQSVRCRPGGGWNCPGTFGMLPGVWHHCDQAFGSRHGTSGIARFVTRTGNTPPTSLAARQGSEDRPGGKLRFRLTSAASRHSPERAATHQDRHPRRTLAPAKPLIAPGPAPLQTLSSVSPRVRDVSELRRLSRRRA